MSQLAADKDELIRTKPVALQKKSGKLAYSAGLDQVPTELLTRSGIHAEHKGVLEGHQPPGPIRPHPVTQQLNAQVQPHILRMTAANKAGLIHSGSGLLQSWLC